MSSEKVLCPPSSLFEPMRPAIFLGVFSLEQICFVGIERIGVGFNREKRRESGLAQP